MLGKQFDGRTIVDRIRLRQIPHGFDQQTLAVNIPRVRGTFTFLTAEIGRDWNRENFGHEYHSPVIAFEQYIAPVGIFQLDFAVFHTKC